MPSDRRAIADHTFAGTDRVFCDTNVWLAIAGHNAARQPEHLRYSAAWRAMLAAASQVFIDPLVLSELVNLWVRLAYDKSPLAESGTDYKSWRSTDEFHAAAADAAQTLAPLLASCLWCPQPLTKQDLLTGLHELPRGRLDLNDLLIVRLCELNDLTLVTHDGDFRHAGVPLLTANRYLLR